MTKHIWLSSKKMTVLVDVQDGRITKTPPIVRKFRGQPPENLIRWMHRQGGLRTHTSVSDTWEKE